MKSILSGLLFLAVGVASAQAANPIATYQFRAGFTPNPYSQTIVIMDDGKVMEKYESYSRNGDRQPVSRITTLAVISADLALALRQKVAAIRTEALKDAQEGQPGCMDAPTEQMSIHRFPGDNMPVAARRACHSLGLPSNSAYDVIALLNGFRALSHLEGRE